MIPWGEIFSNLTKLIVHWSLILRRRRINEEDRKRQNP